MAGQDVRSRQVDEQHIPHCRKIVSGHLDGQVITSVNDGPPASVPNSSDNRLDCSQINDLISTKFHVVMDAVVQCYFGSLNNRQDDCRRVG
jgi:hypothetical protein